MFLKHKLLHHLEQGSTVSTDCQEVTNACFFYIGVLQPKTLQENLKNLLEDLWVKLGSLLRLDEQVGTGDLLSCIQLVCLRHKNRPFCNDLPARKKTQQGKTNISKKKMKKTMFPKDSFCCPKQIYG